MNNLNLPKPMVFDLSSFNLSVVNLSKDIINIIAQYTLQEYKLINNHLETLIVSNNLVDLNYSIIKSAIIYSWDFLSSNPFSISLIKDNIKNIKIYSPKFIKGLSKNTNNDALNLLMDDIYYHPKYDVNCFQTISCNPSNRAIDFIYNLYNKGIYEKLIDESQREFLINLSKNTNDKGIILLKNILYKYKNINIITNKSIDKSTGKSIDIRIKNNRALNFSNKGLILDILLKLSKNTNDNALYLFKDYSYLLDNIDDNNLIKLWKRLLKNSNPIVCQILIDNDFDTIDRMPELNRSLSKSKWTYDIMISKYGINTPLLEEILYLSAGTHNSNIFKMLDERLERGEYKYVNIYWESLSKNEMDEAVNFFIKHIKEVRLSSILMKFVSNSNDIAVNYVLENDKFKKFYNNEKYWENLLKNKNPKVFNFIKTNYDMFIDILTKKRYDDRSIFSLYKNLLQNDNIFELNIDKLNELKNILENVL
jgi:hypothetical protein